MTTETKDETTYSATYPGSLGNYHWPVRFDATNGFVGITQYDEHGNVKDRVLLSPHQIAALMDFTRS